MEGDGWREVYLEDVATEVTVGHVGPMASEYVPDGIPFLRSQNVEPLRLNFSDIKFIASDFHKRLRKSALSPGDVVIVRTGKPGACAVIPKDLPVANCSDLVIVRCGENLDPVFLSYYVNSAAEQHVSSHLVGAVQQHFNVGSARRLLLNLPPIRQQSAIAQTLGSLDDKIELNRRMNQTLEAIARTLFKSWLIDFDPVRAKSEGRSTGLPQHMSDLFPRSFDDSELGEIPTGWALKPIAELASIIGGSTPSTKMDQFWTNGVNSWATPKDLSNLATPVLLRTERKITDAGLAQISSGLLPPGTVLLSSRAPIGYLAISEIPVAINQGFIAMRPEQDIPNLFLLYWAKCAHDQIISRANGSTFLEISKSNFRTIPVTTPPLPILNAFERLARPLYRRLVSNEMEAQALSNIRDGLLPKLLSGEIRIPQK